MDKKYEAYCREGAHHDIIINNNRKLTVQQTIELAKRILETVKSNKPMIAEDSNDCGNKHTHCNWGFCSVDKDHYNSAELNRFPKDFDDHGRISALDTAVKCPWRTVNDYNGCFWSCAIFNRKKKTPTRDDAIAVWEDLIQKLEENGCDL